eukprot:6199674-Pleurochrysis_carterae.AAC.2
MASCPLAVFCTNNRHSKTTVTYNVSCQQDRLIFTHFGLFGPSSSDENVRFVDMSGQLSASEKVEWLPNVTWYSAGGECRKYMMRTRNHRS